MEYSRTTPNRDGSYSTVTTSCSGALVGFVLKWSIAFVLVLMALFWPAGVIANNLHGALAWLTGIAAEVLWLVLVLIGWAWLTTRRKPGKAPQAGNAQPSPAGEEIATPVLVAHTDAGVAAKFQKLIEMRDSEALTPEEFAAAKAKLLG